MRLELYIADLLERHSCVMVPGFGGFVSQYDEAIVQAYIGMFRPPRKKLAFNIHLNSNDGLLQTYIAKVNNCSYEQALHWLQQTVKQWLNKLNQDGQLDISPIGALYSNDNGLIHFIPENKLDFICETFAMSSFHLQPLINAINLPNNLNDSQSAQKQIIPMGQRAKLLSRLQLKWASLLFPFIFISLFWALDYNQSVASKWDVFNYFGPVVFGLSQSSLASDKTEVYAGWNPNTDLWKQKTIMPFVGKGIEFKSESVIPKKDSINNIDKNHSEFYESLKINNKLTVTKETTDSIAHLQFYVVIGSFQDIKNAEKLKSTLTVNGYKIEVMKKGSMFRVGVLGYRTRLEAQKELINLQENISPDAWIAVM